MMSNPRLRMGIHQKRALLDMIEDTFYLMGGKQPTVRTFVDKAASWRIIAGKLNKMGPIRKDPHEWQKAWCCMKCKVRDKHKRLKKKGKFVDGKLDGFTKEDWRVINLCNIRVVQDNSRDKPKPITEDTQLYFYEPDVIIKSSSTFDDEDNNSLSSSYLDSTSQVAHINQFSKLRNKPIPEPTIKRNEPRIEKPPIKQPTVTATPQNTKPPTPDMADISKQLANVVKSLQIHTEMQRQMFQEMQMNNRLQRNVIQLLTDIKQKLPG